jgi:biopolymer transport protein ExbB/TolQ
VWTNQFSGLVEELTNTLHKQEQQRFDVLNDQLTTLIEKFKIGLMGLGDENRECLGRFETTVGRFEVSMEQLLSQIKTEHEGLGNRLVEVSQEFQEHQELLGSKLNDQLELTCIEFGKSLTEIEKTHFSNAESAVAAVEKLDEVVREQLQVLGEGLGASLNEVVQSASVAPKIAADVMGQVQSRLEEQMKRENKLIEDRVELFTDLAEIGSKLNEAAIGHQAAITLLTEAGNAQLEKVGEQTQAGLESALQEVTDASQLIAVGGHELSAMTEMFTIAVDEYRNSNERLLGGLDRIEEALGRAGERSDQQLNLYVSQAREIIDQSMLSHKEVFDELKYLRIQKPVEENA